MNFMNNINNFKLIRSDEIGARIRKRRGELKMSQEKLAEILGVTYQQVQRYENGTNRLNVENIQIVADALAIPLSYFFEGYGELAVKEVQVSHLTPAEDKLLRYFRKIKNNKSKNMLLQVAKLAAMAG